MAQGPLRDTSVHAAPARTSTQHQREKRVFRVLLNLLSTSPQALPTPLPPASAADPSDMSSLTQTLLPRGVDGALGSLLQYEVGGPGGQQHRGLGGGALRCRRRV
jgi:hypothetical protein